ncbi:MAG: type II toxin-antitoxin system VapC family toxin [Schwartzia succinivorans]|jgi:predicted nucleic-acid-binding protein|uniref:PIN domain-containing protein n=1 Tax=Schwartzia succinivorans TaxID=55507 RepID=UPI0023562F15|nr:PIN domain-containing protein [Schwartzia succinivorans]MBE6098025.1 type II toxin-antitoxin system VapC family toxin [Schwartzia succinivorans]
MPRQKNTTKSLVDANIILRYLLQDDDKMFQEAKRIIENGAEALPEVLAEVVYVLMKVYAVGRHEISEALRTMLSEVQVNNSAVIDKALELFGENNLDFVDCILLAYNQVENMSVQTFDKQLKKKLSNIR